MSTSFQSKGHSGDESHHYYRQALAPTAADPLQLGDVWSDTTANLVKRCTSVSPVTFVSTEGGSAAHDLFSATHGDVDEADTPADADVLVFDSGAAKWAAQATVVSINFVIDGGGKAITTGVKGFIEAPFAMTITGWTVLGDQSGSIVVDVWKDTYANYPPTVADTIAGSEKPTISAATKGQDLSLSTWTTTVAAGDIIGFNVDSITTIERATVAIRGTRA